MKGSTPATWDKLWKEHSKNIPHLDEDEWVALAWRVYTRYWQEIFEKHAQGQKLLECGAGSGRISAHMAKRGYECTLLDNSEEGLKAGESTFSREGLKGEFIYGDVTRLELPENEYDIVYSGGLLEHFTDVSIPISEMVKVLKPGGLFAATIIPDRFSCQRLADWMNFFVKFTYHIARGKLKGSIKESRRNFPFYENTLSLKEYTKVMQQCGLGNVVGRGTGPFPSLALPKSWRNIYIAFMEKNIPLWHKFDTSGSWFSAIWGDSYSVYGFKRGV